MHVWIVLGLSYAAFCLFQFFPILFELKGSELQSAFEMWATCTFTVLEWFLIFFLSISTKYLQFPVLPGVGFAEVTPLGLRERMQQWEGWGEVFWGASALQLPVLWQKMLDGAFVVHEWCSTWKNFLASFDMFCLLVLFAPRVQGRGLN